MDEQEICKEITHLHESILAAGVVENQHLQITEFAAKHGYTILDWYADE